MPSLRSHVLGDIWAIFFATCRPVRVAMQRPAQLVQSACWLGVTLQGAEEDMHNSRAIRCMPWLRPPLSARQSIFLTLEPHFYETSQ